LENSKFYNITCHRNYSKNLSAENHIVVEWHVQNEGAIKYYEIEKSADGRTFSIVATRQARDRNLNQVNYRWLDINAATGSNFYRIRSAYLDGEIKYSGVVKVITTKDKSYYLVSPNPLTYQQYHFSSICQST